MVAHDPIEDDIVAALRRIVRAIDLQSRRMVDEFGLTATQLGTILFDLGASFAQIAQLVVDEFPSISELSLAQLLLGLGASFITIATALQDELSTTAADAAGILLGIGATAFEIAEALVEVFAVTSAELIAIMVDGLGFGLDLILGLIAIFF